MSAIVRLLHGGAPCVVHQSLHETQFTYRASDPTIGVRTHVRAALMDNVAVPCMLMRGGTSKGPLFIASDLPGRASARDDLLLSLMGSPDIRQIDRIGGGDSLTSQALIVGPSSREY